LGKIFMQLGEAMADRWAARRAVWPQYLLPKQALTAFAGWVATRRWGHATTRLIAWFVNKYQVDMAQAAQPDIAAYAHFNDFFTRALRSDARPLAAARWLCPVDGAISQFGAIENGQIFQAKGHAYSATALVGGDSALAAQFAKGSFATLYLSPRDYHRIHMPCAATLRQMVYVPGELFSVNPTTARGVPGLFARNERVVCVFDTTQGPMVLVLVGATIVGSMATVWHGVVNPPRTGRISRHDYPGGQVQLAQGEEMGRFLLGSTVVLLLPEAAPGWNPGWQPGGPVCMGQVMAGAS
jgi:phosphatidylserine decarboxylase